MKRTRLLFILAFIALPFAVIGQNPTAPTEIILNVDTDSVQPGINAWSSCWFADQSEGDDPRTFLTEADLEEVLEWKGQSKNGNDEIYIRMIQRASGPNVFDRDSINANSGQRVIRATVRNPTARDRQGNPTQDYKYKIFFTINGTNGTRYIIDPIIRTNM